MSQKAIATISAEDVAERTEAYEDTASERMDDFLSGQMQIRKIGPSPSSRRR